MHCPHCVDLELEPQRVSSKGVEVDRCNRCKGVWFDAQELSRILTTVSTRLSPPRGATVTRRTCPKCFIPLAAFDYPDSDVEIDMCPECHGLWLDRSEFREIKLVGRASTLPGAPSPAPTEKQLNADLLNWINAAIEQVMGSSRL